MDVSDAMFPRLILPAGTYGKYLSFLDIPHTTRSIDIIADNTANLIDTLAGIHHNTPFELRLTAFFRMFLEYGSCLSSPGQCERLHVAIFRCTDPRQRAFLAQSMAGFLHNDRCHTLTLVKGFVIAGQAACFLRTF